MSLRFRLVMLESRGFLVGFLFTLLLILGCGTDAVGNLIAMDPQPHTPEGGSAPTSTATPTAS